MMNIKVGMLISHPKRPEWGPGKVLLVEADKVIVYFRDAREGKAGEAIKTINTRVVTLGPADVESDPWLDRLPSLVRNGRVHPMPRPRLTFVQAVEKFQAMYPAGFRDPRYLEDEYNFKRKAHDSVARMGLTQASGTQNRGALQVARETPVEAFVEKLQSALNGLNLLSIYEKSALRDGLRGDSASAVAFRDALCGVCASERPERSTFEALIEAVSGLPADAGRARVATWPVLTLVPFIARPDSHMFLKPEMTQRSAESLAYDLAYSSELNWGTYERLLDMSRLLFERLRPLGAADFIDVQSFMWVTVGT